MKKCLGVYLFSFFVFSHLYGQLLSEPQQFYLQKHIHIISKDSAVNQRRWEKLGSQLKNKKIILIGENNHGSKEIFQWRNDLIRYLHQNEGFNTVLFESGFGELLPGREKDESFSPLQMIRGLFGSWRTPEFRDLMAYIKSEQMSWGGFDVQRTGGGFRELLNSFCLAHGVDSLLYLNLETRYGLLMGQLNNRKPVYDSVMPMSSHLMRDYQILSNHLSAILPDSSHRQVLLLRQTLKNRITYLNYMLQFVKDKDWSQRWASRDSMMAENLIFLINYIYPGQKIIIIAHNFHISKWNELEEIMGEIINSRYPKQTYVLGLFSRAGSYADNSGNPVSMTAPDSTRLDIKHLIGAMKGYAGFMGLKTKTIPRWLYDPVVVNDSFIDLNGSNQLILPKHFDGLLLLQKVSPATRLE